MGFDVAVRIPGPKELYVRLGQKVRATAERAFPNWLQDRQSTVERATAGRVVTAREIADCLVDDRVHEDLRAITDDPLLAYADRVLSGEVRVFGGSVTLPTTADGWQTDPSSGKNSGLGHWSSLNTLDESISGNKKYVWEINRHQFMLSLATAYAMTGDERYAEKIWSLVDHWIDANPEKQGINWVSSLELSFRSIAWLWSIALSCDWPGWTEQRLARVQASLLLQGLHVRNYLSTYYSPNTHITGEALGLFYLGCVFRADDRFDGFAELGTELLEEFIDLHILDDGIYFEQSTWYQKYTLDFYYHYFRLAQREGRAARVSSCRRLHACCVSLNALRHGDGSFARFGDDDGGALFPLDGDPRKDWDVMLGLVERLFSDATERPSGTLATVLGVESPLDGDLSLSTPAIPPSEFCDGGYFVIASAEPGSVHKMFVDAGYHGWRNGGHAHADALSFELSFRGRPVFVDPGTYTYSAAADLRNRYRSGASHNTVTVDGNASSLASNNPFQWRLSASVDASGLYRGAHVQYLHGTARGFSMSQPITHSREVLFVDDAFWLLVDHVSTDPRELTASFHLATGFDVDVRDASAVARNGDVLASIAFAADCERPIEIAPEPYEFSRSFGESEDAMRIKASTTSTQLVSLIHFSDAPNGEENALRPQITQDDSGLVVKCAEGEYRIEMSGEDPSARRWTVSKLGEADEASWSEAIRSADWPSGGNGVSS